MRTYPIDSDDFEGLARLNAADWQTDTLKANPQYVWWGNFEDSMAFGTSWDKPLEYAAWSEWGGVPDDLNECVNFYFELTRDSQTCAACDGTGYNPATRQIKEDYYDFDGRGTRWVNKITQDEVDLLWEDHRLRDFKEKPTAEQVNEWSKRGMGHDSINAMLLIKHRATRLGVYGQCDVCDGHGNTFTAPAARLALQLWILHPRKGAARGVYIRTIEQSDLPSVYAYLRAAAERNAARFSNVPDAADEAVRS